jgi:hypothetical protein
MHVLQPRDTASRVHFCSWFLQSVVEGEIDLQLTRTAFSTPPVVCEFLTISLIMLSADWHIDLLAKFTCTLQFTGCHEVQSCEPVNKGKNLPVH